MVVWMLAMALAADPSAQRPVTTPPSTRAAIDATARELEKIRIRSYLRDNFAREVVVPDYGADQAWLNTERPLSLHDDLRGRVVLIDFWTYCCINCLHVMPDLHYLEERFADDPFVVVGAHAAKFDTEKETAAIREAVLRYDVRHPVVNDAGFLLWQQLGVRSWPTFVLLGPDSRMLAAISGEGHRQTLELMIEVALELYAEEGLDPKPLPLRLERDTVRPGALAYPGKLLIHDDRLFVADTNHNRIVVTDLDGALLQVVGSGAAGLSDGSATEATFRQPQGMAVLDGGLFVADTENHAVRRVDLKTWQVTTVAGNGSQARGDYRGGKSGREQALSSPWDLAAHDHTLHVAMAGTHQLWTVDPSTGTAAVWAGTGREQNLDGPGDEAAFAQPSGLSSDGERLFLADSESSSIRAVNLTDRSVAHVVGGSIEPSDLFSYGDADGEGYDARLQHPLGVLALDGKVYVADTYNHRIKVVDPRSDTIETLAGTGLAGAQDGRFEQATFSEPSGLAHSNGRLFVSDTNNHRVRVLDLKARTVSTLDLSDVPVPMDDLAREQADPELPVLAGALRTELPPAPLMAGQATLSVQVSLPPGRKLTAGAPSAVQVLSTDAVVGATVDLDRKARATVPIQVLGTGETEVRALVYHCVEDKDCRADSLVARLPVVAGARSELVVDLTLP